MLVTEKINRRQNRYEQEEMLRKHPTAIILRASTSLTELLAYIKRQNILS